MRRNELKAKLEYLVDQTGRVEARANPARKPLDKKKPTPRGDPVTKLLHKFLRQEKLTPLQCNNGMCEEAAQFVEESLPGSSIRYTEDIDPDDELDLPGHAWVCWLGRAYDAEAPQGVASWRELPIFQAKLATDADAADDADEVVRLPAARSNPAALKAKLEDLVDRTGRVEDMLEVLAGIYLERARTPDYRTDPDLHDAMLATAHVLHEASEAVAGIFEDDEAGRGNPSPSLRRVSTGLYVTQDGMWEINRVDYPDRAWWVFQSSDASDKLVAHLSMGQVGAEDIFPTKAVAVEALFDCLAHADEYPRIARRLAALAKVRPQRS